MRASLRESRLKKGDRQTTNKPKKKIKYIPTTSYPKDILIAHSGRVFSTL